MWLVVPPEQHEHSEVKPESTPDEIASDQMNKCLEPRPDGEAKGEPIKQHHEHEEYRNGPHFPVPFTDTSYCTNGTRRSCRKPWSMNRPGLHPRAASTAQWRAKFERRVFTCAHYTKHTNQVTSE
jgi:hypothetical protein